MWKHLVANALTLFILILVVAFGVIAWGQREYVAEGPLDGAICVQVESGSTMRRVSHQLEEQGAIRNASIFRVGAEYTDKTAELKAGSFLLPAGVSMEEIVDLVTRGGRSTCGTEIVYRIGIANQRVEVRELDPATNRFASVAEFDPVAPAAENGDAGDADAIAAAAAAYDRVRESADTRYRIAVAEGVTSWQVVEALKAVDFLGGEIAEVPAEGALAPDSYEVAPGADRTELLAQMGERQQTRIEEAWQNRADDLPIGTEEEALILASIIEKETGVPEERRQVASVFVNRLKRGMRLQTDPTVIYGITEGKGTLGRGLRRSELDRETPFNTYQIDGLPPTPIANPGAESLRAATDPDETEFLYFVADGTGGHAFATTLDEHNANVARWREVEAQRAKDAAEAPEN